MSKQSRTDLKTSDFLIARSQLDNSIIKIVTPQHFEIGLNDDEFQRVLLVHGSIQSTKGVFSPIISGSLQTLLDGTPFLKSGTNIQITTGSDGSVTINSSLAGSPGVLAAGTALAFTGGGGYDTSVGKVLNVEVPTTSTVLATASDKILVSQGGSTEVVEVSSILSIGSTGVLANPITLGDGIYDSAFGAGSWDNSAAATIAVDLYSTNPGLEFNAGGLRAKVDGSTIDRTVSGLAVLAVPNTLSDGTGINSLSYDGSSGATVSIDTTIVPRLGSSNTFTGVNTFSSLTGGSIIGSIQEVSPGTDYLIAGSNITVSKDTPSAGQITISAALGTGATLSEGNGISIPGGYDGSVAAAVSAVGNNSRGIYVGASGIEINAASLSTSGDRNSYLFMSDGTSGTTKQTAGTIIDSVDRTAIMAEKVNGGIQIDFYGNSNPAQFSIDLDGGTLTLGPNGLSVDSVPYSLTNSTGIAAFSFDGSSAKSVAIDTTIVPRKNVNNTWTGDNSFNAPVYASNLSGSLTNLVDGTSYLREGTNVSISTGSDGAVTISAVASSGGLADGNAKYLVLQATGSLSNERVFTAGDGISTVDAGAGNNYTVSIDLATDPGLQFTAGELDTKLDPNDTIRKSAAGLTVNKVPHDLQSGAGISSFSFWGDAPGQVVSIDQTQVPMLANDNSWTGDNIFTAGLSGSLQMLQDGATRYIVGGTGINVFTGSNGQVTVETSGPTGISSIEQDGGSSYSNITAMIFTGSLVSEPSAGTAKITPVIGAPEDGDYTDGLFTDFSYGTNIGTAIDRFNEVLKGLAPSAAPSLDDIGCNDSGTAAKLSFGSSQSIVDYTNAQPSTLSPSSGLSDTNINQDYNIDTASNDLQRACFNGSVTINGTLNADIPADGVNYDADSFGNANQGTLKLYVNDAVTPVHTTNLSSFGSGNSLTAGSGFNLTASTPGHFADGSNFETFQHRQGTYIIAGGVTPSDVQRDGWNWAKVVHEIGGIETVTNYVEWVNDSTSDSTYPLTATGASFGTLSMTGTKYLSGVKYYTNGSATYSVTVDNAYRNVYSNSSIAFNGTNCGDESQSFDVIDWAGGEDESKQMSLSQLMTINVNSILNGSITTTLTVPHPLRADLSGVSSQSHNGILLYDRSDNSTDTYESFRGESKRVVSGSYDTQADWAGGDDEWTSSTSLLTVDGLMFYDQELVAPDEGINGGDFRNTGDGGTITNGPTGNVNYSGITTGLRTFYRWFRNPAAGSDRTGFDLDINGSGTIVSQGTSLTGNKISILCKLPAGSAGTTGWMDLALPFATGQTADGDGCYSGAFDSSLSADNTVSFGTQTVAAGEYVMVKIEADASWTGNISSMTVTWS